MASSSRVWKHRQSDADVRIVVMTSVLAYVDRGMVEVFSFGRAGYSRPPDLGRDLNCRADFRPANVGMLPNLGHDWIGSNMKLLSNPAIVKAYFVTHVIEFAYRGSPEEE